MQTRDIIDDNLLAAYAEGRTGPEETMRVARALAEDESLREVFHILRGLETDSAGEEVPMERMAAASEGGLCDVQCERRILRDFLPDTEIGDTTGFEHNAWLPGAGVPLHAIGRMLEAHGMTVTRRYDASESDIRDNLAARVRMIAVVDGGTLSTGSPSGLLHAVVILTFHQGMLRIYDPAVDHDTDTLYEQFDEAWSASRRYLVSASLGGMRYRPHPIDVSDVDLDADLLDLTEAIAENAHEVWALDRSTEGWTYGPRRDDAARQHPDMVPYCDLPDGEKEYDRRMAFQTLRLVKKLGFRVSRAAGDPCPHCGSPVERTMNFCPTCGKPLSHNDFH